MIKCTLQGTLSRLNAQEFANVHLVFEERGKPEYLEKILSEQGQKPTTNSAHI